jgi:hydroxymethylglutaryl-CoA lyase
MNMRGDERSVRLREVGLRDGLQSIAKVMPSDDKQAWISAEFAAGVREIEVCSFVPARLLPQFADAAEIVRHALGLHGLTVAALVPNPRGAEAALELGVHKINYVTSASESHNRANVRRSRDESLAGFAEVARLVRGSRTVLAGGVSTAFGCTIEGPVAQAEVMRIVDGYLAAGAQELVLADTVGYADPQAVRALVRRVRRTTGTLPVALHLHDTRGLGLANVVAGLEVGVRDFDAALGGMGGCPHAPGASGNIVSEDLAFLLQAMGWQTGIELARLVAVRDILARALPEVALLGALAKAGLPKGFEARLAVH